MKKYLTFIFYLFESAFGGNILFLNAVPSPSHHVWNHHLALALLEKGHNITMVGPDVTLLGTPKNYQPILLEGLHEALGNNFDLVDTVNYNVIDMMKFFYDYEVLSCTVGLESNGFKQLMDYPSNFKFDLIILDVTIGACLYPFVQKFNYPPTIGVTAFLLPSYVSSKFGNHLYPSYVPWCLLSYTSDMTFLQRLWNFIFTHVDNFYRHFIKIPHLEGLQKQKFGLNMDSVLKIERHISLVLSNTDPNLDHAQPLTPNIIPVGGLHAVPPRKLPKDLQKIVSKAANGVILFSLGTNIRSDKIDIQKRQAILSVLGKLNQTVIWKFESDIEHLPKNVVVRKWLPQNDILGHPNTVLFVNHGGALSTHEAIYHGIPMMGIPFFVDQYISVNRVVDKMIGIHVDYLQITAEYLLQKFEEILNNPLYSKNMKETSRRYRDQQQTPLERAVFWTEYVMRHKDAQFLDTKARDLSIFVASSADVIIFLAFLIFGLIYLSIYIVRSIIKNFRQTNVTKKKMN